MRRSKLKYVLVASLLSFHSYAGRMLILPALRIQGVFAPHEAAACPGGCYYNGVLKIGGYATLIFTLTNQSSLEQSGTLTLLAGSPFYSYSDQLPSGYITHPKHVFMCSPQQNSSRDLPASDQQINSDMVVSWSIPPYQMIHITVGALGHDAYNSLFQWMALEYTARVRIDINQDRGAVLAAASTFWGIPWPATSLCDGFSIATESGWRGHDVRRIPLTPFPTLLNGGRAF